MAYSPSLGYCSILPCFCNPNDVCCPRPSGPVGAPLSTNRLLSSQVIEIPLPHIGIADGHFETILTSGCRMRPRSVLSPGRIERMYIGGFAAGLGSMLKDNPRTASTTHIVDWAARPMDALDVRLGEVDVLVRHRQRRVAQDLLEGERVRPVDHEPLGGGVAEGVRGAAGAGDAGGLARA